MSIDLQRTSLGSFGQKLIRVFSLPIVSNEHIVGRAQTLRTAVRSCLHFFVDVNGAFCSENPTGRDLFRRWSRKSLALAENNVYYRKRGSASYIVREVQSVRERERE